MVDEAVLISTYTRKPITFEEAVEKFEIGRIVKRFGTWVVTDYGMECLVHYYPIEKGRLPEWYWRRHMAAKRWVNLVDFEQAYVFALDYHARRPGKKKRTKEQRTRNERQKMGLSLRWKVLQRDGFKCQTCGRGQPDGVRLEVDHKHPVSKGGRSTMNNLWTLCFECNHGKFTKPLTPPSE
jgi:hypothetical protein